MPGSPNNHDPCTGTAEVGGKQQITPSTSAERAYCLKYNYKWMLAPHRAARSARPLKIKKIVSKTILEIETDLQDQMLIFL